MERSWQRLAPPVAALVALGIAAGAGSAAPLPTPYINLQTTQAHDSGGHTVVSVWMATNAGRALNTPTGDGYPLVFTQPWHTTCQPDPRRPLPGGKVQLVYSGVSNNVAVKWQPVVSFPTSRAQQLTFCAYVVTVPHPEILFSVVAMAHSSVAVPPPRGRSPRPFNQGPWRSCPANHANQLLRVLANTGLSNGCHNATTIANTWIAQWRNTDGRDNWGNGWLTSTGQIQNLTYPKVKWTSVPVSSLHRTLMCQESAVTPSYELSDLIVNCGLASFRFAPRL